MLYLVATPIGHLGDISPRAVETLKQVDVIAAEDTRITGGLLHKLGVNKKMLSYHDHNAEKMRPKILQYLIEGKDVALVSDAGTPLISDPGYKLVQDVYAQGLKVTAIPGPSAPILALILSGLPTDRFYFGGFLPSKSGERKRTLEAVKDIPATLIFFETAPRLAKALSDALAVLGDRDAAIAREMTKLYEEIIKGMLSGLAEKLGAVAELRGELVLVIAPPLPKPAASDEDIKIRLAFYLQDHSPSKAAAIVAREFDVPRARAYDMAIKLK